MISPKSIAMTRDTSAMNSRSLCSIRRMVSFSSSVQPLDQLRERLDLAAA